MSLYFLGNGKRMAKARDKILMKEMGYSEDPNVKGGKRIVSSDKAIAIEFGLNQVKVCIQDESMIHPCDSSKHEPTERYTEKARPYLERLKSVLKPRKVIDIFNKDITDTLGIE
jgi:hypothetical protein